MSLNSDWHKSTYSGTQGSCVRARVSGERVEIGDSKDPGGRSLLVEPAAWSAFIKRVSCGDLRP